MNPWFAKAAILAGSVALVVVPHVAHGRRRGEFKVAKSRRGPLESVSLTLVSVAFLLPLVWVATPVLAFADYALHPVPFVAGIACLATGSWLLYRSHADLGDNWSITLEVRENHQLVTQGVYRHLRHPMYLALLLHAAGQALVAPNWVAGPAYGVGFVILFAQRVGREERMLREEFGKDYEAYAARTRRILPGVW